MDFGLELPRLKTGDWKSDNKSVGNADTLAENNLSVPLERMSSGKLAFLLATLLLGLTLAGSVCIYLGGVQALSKLGQTRPAENGTEASQETDPSSASKTLKEIDTWVRQLSIASAAGGAGGIVLMIVNFIWWRNRSLRCMSASAPTHAQRRP